MGSTQLNANVRCKKNSEFSSVSVPVSLIKYTADLKEDSRNFKARTYVGRPLEFNLDQQGLKTGFPDLSDGDRASLEASVKSVITKRQQNILSLNHKPPKDFPNTLMQPILVFYHATRLASEVTIDATHF